MSAITRGIGRHESEDGREEHDLKQHFLRLRIGNPLVWFSMLALFGCGAGVTVQVKYDKQADFTALRSFAFKEAGNGSRMERSLRQAIQAELLARGYEKAGASADFHIVYHAALQKKTIWQREFSSTGVPTGVVPITFDEGTIAIEIIDPKTQKTIWTGQAQEAIDNETQALGEIQPEVKKVLARFPPP